MIDWRHWHNEPYLVGGLIFLGWAYAVACGPLRGRLGGDVLRFPRREAWMFYSGLVVFYLAVGSPLDQAGERFLLSAHMIQHQLLIYPAAILFLLGLPVWLVDGVFARVPFPGLRRRLLHPFTCAAIYIGVLSAWHVPEIYDWALQDKLVHVIEHVMFFVAALFYWWPILAPSRVYPPVNPGVQILYLVAVTIGMTPLFAFLAFSQDVLYPTYEYAPRLIARLGPAEDQLLGAVIMKLGGLLVTFFTLAVAFYRWHYDSEVRNYGRP